jgi:hypothetical protein
LGVTPSHGKKDKTAAFTPNKEAIPQKTLQNKLLYELIRPIIKIL